MTQFTVYDATGRILRSGLCQLEFMDIQAGEGEFVIPVASIDSDHYVDVITKTLVNIPEQPDTDYVFDYNTKTWLDLRTLSDIQDAKWELIKQKRSNIEFGKFTYNGMVFDGNSDAQRRFNTYISVSKSAIAAGNPFSAQFILADNSIVTLQAEDFVAIELVKTNQVANAFATAAKLRTLIYADTASIADVLAVTWPDEV